MGGGILAGYAFPVQSQEVQVVSKIFLRMIKCILVPLVFSALVVGIAGHSDDLKAVGRLAFKTIVYFEVVTTLALFIGLAAVNVTQPGVGIQLPPPGSGADTDPNNANDVLKVKPAVVTGNTLNLNSPRNRETIIASNCARIYSAERGRHFPPA